MASGTCQESQPRHPMSRPACGRRCLQAGLTGQSRENKIALTCGPDSLRLDAGWRKFWKGEIDEAQHGSHHYHPGR
jgi:hypothetical protein